MGPMGNVDMCDETGRPNNKMLQYFFARAKDGTGLLTTGLIPVSHGINNSITELGKLTMFPRIDRSRTVFSGWRDLAQGVHAYGSKIFIQLTPGLGRVGPPSCLVNEKKFPVSASFNPNFYIPELPCMRLLGSGHPQCAVNTWQPILPTNIPNPLAKKIGLETTNLTLDADLVVLAMGGRADETIFFHAQKEHAASELYNIGDSYHAGRVLEATRAAYNLATRI